MAYVDLGIDRSILVMLTPDEIKNMLTDFAGRYHSAKLNGCETSLDDFTNAYYNMSQRLLRDTDQTRFLYNN